MSHLSDLWIFSAERELWNRITGVKVDTRKAPAVALPGTWTFNRSNYFHGSIVRVIDSSDFSPNQFVLFARRPRVELLHAAVDVIQLSANHRSHWIIQFVFLLLFILCRCERTSKSLFLQHHSNSCTAHFPLKSNLSYQLHTNSFLFPSNLSFKTSSAESHEPTDQLWTTLDLESPFTDLSVWSENSALHLHNQCIPSHDSDFGAIVNWSAYVLSKDARPSNVPYRVNRSSNYIAEIVSRTFYKKWISIVHAFLVVYIECSRPCRECGQSRLNSTLRKIEGYDLREHSDDKS